jgi:vitamin B12 transporter
LKSQYIFYQVALQIILCNSFGQAQEIPLKYIPEVTVKTNKEYFSEDQTTLSIDREELILYREQNLGTMLEKETPALIRAYGAEGSVISISLHGTGSNHAQVCWNGFALNSPTSGQADLSLIPVGFIQSVEVINGASGALFGSGTFGGSINLRNEPDWNNKLSVINSFDAGSYSSIGNILTLRLGSRHFQFHMAAISRKAENDFHYTDFYRYHAPDRVASHNEFRTTGLIQNFYMNLGRGSILEAGIWYQFKIKQLPALMGSYKESFAEQKDSSFRSFISLRKASHKSTLVLKSAWFYDYLRYTDQFSDSDSGYSVNSRISTSRFMNEADYRYYLTDHVILGGGSSYNLISGNSNNYDGNIKENEYAFFGNAKFILKNWILNTGIRKEFYEGINPAIQYSIGIRYKAGEHVIVRSGLSNKFRKPTINEKFWNPGGNPLLRPEKGWGGDLTFEYSSVKEREEFCRINASLTGYFQHVDNWIQWVIRDSLTPVEYKQVVAKGIEAKLNYRFVVGLFRLRGLLNYGYNRSIIIKTYDSNPFYEGNQLMYVPLHTAGGGITADFEGFEIGTSEVFTGCRETVETADRALQLPAYCLVDVFAGFHKEFMNMKLGMLFRISNLFNRQYEVIRSYPMPGRTFQLIITLGFEKKNSNNIK